MEKEHYIKFATTFNMFNKLFINCLIEDVLDASPRTDIIKTTFNNIKTQLHPYQINNVNWMINIEKNVEKSLLEKNVKNLQLTDSNVKNLQLTDSNVKNLQLTDNNIKGNDTVLKESTNNNNVKCNDFLPIFKGGGLFDEVGMGKTLQTITLINENKATYNKMFKGNKLFSKATLGIIPNHLCGQWAREFEKHQKSPIKIIELLTKHHYKKYSCYDFINADVVIVSSRFFKNCELEIFESYTPLTSVSELFEFRVNICGIHWHRIFIDEFHEIECDKLFTMLKYIESDYRWIISGTPLKEHYIDVNNYDRKYGLKDIDYNNDFFETSVCNYSSQFGYHNYNSDDDDDDYGYRYNMYRRNKRRNYYQEPSYSSSNNTSLLFDKDYYDGKMLQSKINEKMTNDIMKNHENKANDYIFENVLLNSSIGQIINYLTFDANAVLKFNLEHYEQYKYVLSNFSRNLHINNVNVLKLPNIKEKIVWLKFSDTERMIYNSHLVDDNNQMVDEFLRQICCHPMLCDKLRETVKIMNESGKTFSLIEMQSEIKKVYLKDFEKAEKDVVDREERIQRYELRKKEIEEKHKATLNAKTTLTNNNISNVNNITLTNNNISNVNNVTLTNNNVSNVNNATLTNNNINNATLTNNNINNATLTNNNISNANETLTNNTNTTLINNTNQTLTNNTIPAEKLKINTAEYLNLIEAIKEQNEKLVDETKIRDGKSKTLQYYITFIDILKDNKKIETKECPICLCNISVDDVAVSKCAHMFCYSCIHTVITQSQSKKCPTCNKTLELSDIFLVNEEEEKVEEEKIEDKPISDVDKYGTKLAYLINYIKSTKNKYRILYSQWDDLLKEIGKVLNENGIKSLFCMGNVYQKDKVLKMFNSMSENEEDNCKVIMLSSKHTISGSNLSNAEEVIFIDPFYGTKQDRENMRNQAIGRVRRLGNKFLEIDVIDLLIKDTVEENIYKHNCLEGKNGVVV